MTTSIDELIEIFWQERQRGSYFPPAWFDKLTLDQAYRIQLGLIDRRQFKRDGEGYLRAFREHIHLFDLAAKASHQLTSGPYDDADAASAMARIVAAGFDPEATSQAPTGEGAPNR